MLFSGGNCACMLQLAVKTLMCIFAYWNLILFNLMMLLYGNSVTTDCSLLFTDFEN